MPRFMPNERQAAASAFGRWVSTGPTSQAAANSSAVLARITARYSSSVVAAFLAAPRGAPSRPAAAAPPRARGGQGGGRGQDGKRRQRPDLDHHLEGLAEQEIAAQHARLV